MKSGFTTLAKLLAICFTLSLLGGYVWWRADRVSKEDAARLDALNAAEQKAIATIKSNIAKDQAEAEQSLQKIQELKESERELLMSGSKSERVMPSSKSGIAIDLDQLIKKNPDLQKALEGQQEESKHEGEEPDPPAKDRVLLPGSKAPSGILRSE